MNLKNSGDSTGFEPMTSVMPVQCSNQLRGCLHDNGATFITGRDEKLHRVYIKLCLLGCEPYSAVKLMKF